MQRLVDVDESIVDNIAMRWHRHRKERVKLHRGQLTRRSIVMSIEIDLCGELLADLVKGMRPLAEPFEHTSVKKSWRSGGAVFEAFLARIHHENDM